MRPLILTILLSILALPLVAQARTTNDPLRSDLWYLDQISVGSAWETEIGSPDVVVAVIDTGVDTDHPDLAENIWTNLNEVPGDGIDNDANGYIDDVHGWDFIGNDNDPRPTPLNTSERLIVSHGTLIAGIIAAVGDNNEGVVGVSWGAKIMPLRIVDIEGAGNDLDATHAVRYAMDNGADVINLSLVGSEVQPQFEDAIHEAIDRGITVVAALGNEGANGNADTGKHIVYPACIDGVIGVAATSHDDDKASFSSYGRCADLAAPGVDFYGTFYNDNRLPYFSDLYGGTWNGTSAAAPVVSGAAALLLSHFPTLTPEEVRIVLQLSVDPIRYNSTTAYAGRVGTGRINIARAFEVAPSFAPSVNMIESDDFSLAFGNPGEEPYVEVQSLTGETQSRFLAYDATYTGGLAVTTGDIDEDGVHEIIVAPLSEGETHVRWFEQDGALGGEIPVVTPEFLPHSLALADINGIGQPVIIVSGAGETGDLVRWFSRSGTLLDEIQTPAFVGKLVAVGDVALTPGREFVFLDEQAGLVTTLNREGKVINRFQAALPGATHLTLSIADTDFDRVGEVIVSSFENGALLSRVFNWQGVLVGIM